MMRGFLRIVLFVVAGPYVGLLAMALLIGSYTLATTGSPRDFVFGPELVAPGILLIAYTIGGIPALASGIVALFVAPRLVGWRYWLVMALVGGLISLAGTFLLVGGGPEMIGVREQAPVIVLVTLAGAIAAFACAALFDGLASLLGRKQAA
jgi:hypothetical protein